MVNVRSKILFLYLKKISSSNFIFSGLNFLFFCILLLAANGNAEVPDGQTQQKIDRQRSDFLKNADLFVENLNKLSIICSTNSSNCFTINSYHPWIRPYLLVNRINSNEFFGVNLDCPSDWACEKAVVGNAQIKTIHGFSNLPFEAPQNRNYQVYHPEDQDIKSNIGLLLSSAGISDLLLSFSPWDIQGASSELAKWFTKDWFLTYELLHEGFHAYIQFPRSANQGLAWQNDFVLFPKASRDSVNLCRPNDSNLVNAEDLSLKALSNALIEKDSSKNLLLLVKDWQNKRETRYQSLSAVSRPDGKLTECRTLDLMYERVEGMADYVGLTSVRRLGLISNSQIQMYYNALYFKSSARSPDYGFYAFGFFPALILDKLDQTGKWQQDIFSFSDQSYLQIIDKYSAPSKAQKNEK